MARGKASKNAHLWTPEKDRDWGAIEAEYRAAHLSLAELERKYRVPKDTITSRAKARGWSRSNKEAVAVRRSELLREDAASVTASRATIQTAPSDDGDGSALDSRKLPRACAGSDDFPEEALAGVPLPGEEGNRAAMLQALGLAPDRAPPAALPAAEYERLAIELAARTQVEVIRSHKKTLGRLHGLIDRTLGKLERYADGDETAIRLGDKESVGSMIRDLSTAMAKVVPLERQVHNIDAAQETVMVFTPFMGIRDVPPIEADFTEVPTEEAPAPQLRPIGTLKQIRGAKPPEDDDETED